MTEENIKKTLDAVSTAQNAVTEIFSCLNSGQKEQFLELAEGLRELLRTLIKTGEEQKKEMPILKLASAAESTLDSLERIVAYSLYNIPLALHKTEYELIPFVNSMYSDYYFLSYIFPNKELWNDYYNDEMHLLNNNPYVKNNKGEGFKYDLSIYVVAYNKLDYTKMCVEGLINNIPKNLSCELILLNHGSSDDTKEYFESIKPAKQIDVKINRSFFDITTRICEGEFILAVSNDVLVTPHAIENMVRAMREDPQIGAVVPATSNVSNLQTIPAKYSNPEEMMIWAEKNNAYDPFRHEVRNRLVNPIEMVRNDLYQDIFPTGYLISGNGESVSFPDDVAALLFRRKGYKLVLAKDAYCFHYGSVTIKEEMKARVNSAEEEMKLYHKGQKDFENMFGIDPWGTGYCYDPSFIYFDCKFEGHVEILGINTGLGANPLRIREAYKEKKHNLDVRLTFMDQDKKFFEDVKGFADETKEVTEFGGVFSAIGDRKYHYIVYEDPFKGEETTLKDIEKLSGLLVPGGEVYIKADGAIESPVYDCILSHDDRFKSDWVRLIKK